jgi:hypothetical protein
MRGTTLMRGMYIARGYDVKRILTPPRGVQLGWRGLSLQSAEFLPTAVQLPHNHDRVVGIPSQELADFAVDPLAPESRAVADVDDGRYDLIFIEDAEEVVDVGDLLPSRKPG